MLDPTAEYTLKVYNGGLEDDEVAGELVSSGEISVNGQIVVASHNFNQNVSVISEPVTLATSNQLLVTLKGKPGGVATVEIIGVDDTAPIITASVDPPANAAGWHNGDVTVTFDCADATSGIATCPDPAVVPSEGPDQVLSGTAVDRAGNAASASVTINLDKTPPVVTSTTDAVPNPNGWNNTDVTVSFSAADSLSGISQVPSPITVSTEGADQTVSGTATDVAGNSASASLTVNIDKTPPEVTISEPVDGTTVSDSPITATGTASDPVSGIDAIACNGSPAEVTGTTYSCQIALTEGDNPVLVQATDRAGNTGSSSVTVALQTADTTPPTIAFIRPAAGSTAFIARPALEVDYHDADSGIDTARLSFTANGSPISVSCGSVTVSGATCVPVADLPDGSVTVGASIADQEGNAGLNQVDIIVDGQPVQVTITEPTDRSITSAESILVRGTTGSDIATISINGVPAAFSGSSFEASVPLREGTNMLVALATKTNGKTGTDTVDVTRDIFAPTVRINSPRDGFDSVNDTVTVTGVVNDIVDGTTDPQVTVNGLPAMVSNGTFLLLDVPLRNGDNAITAIASDAAGNTGEHTITVNRRSVLGARILATGGNGQSASVHQTLPIPLVVAVQDDGGNPVAGRVVTFEVSRNSGTLQASPVDPPKRRIQVPTNGSGQASVRFTLGDTAGAGNNRVRATALGVAGEAEFCASASPGAPDKILMVQGDNQLGVIGNPLPTPLEAWVVDAEGNPLDGVPVTFTVTKGTGAMDGETTRVIHTASDGKVRVVLTLGFDPGINNHVVRATFPDLSGLPAIFTASALEPGSPADTRFSGVVLDNGLTPIPQATVAIPGTSLATTTDEQGRFLLDNVPAGHIHLRIDPTGSPRPETFPPLEFETVTIAGHNNTLGQPILIPALDLPNARTVGGPQDVSLTMEGVAGSELTVFANSVTFPDGTSAGQISFSQVHLDKVPMPPPNGGVFMPPAWTIQPAGAAFDPPARVQIPNSGLPPGRVVTIFQFDHAINQFIPVGPGAVSEDGSVIVSDPGFGITRAGWGGAPPPPPPITDNEGPACPEANHVSPLEGADLSDIVMPPLPDGRFDPAGNFRREKDGKTMRAHRGVDIAAPVGTPVRAIADGQVVFTCSPPEEGGVCPDSGNQVSIRHPDGGVTRYFHLQDFSVTEGDTVTAGQEVGRVGVTGNSSPNNPHLHLEYRDGSNPTPPFGEALDPTGCI